MFSQMIQSKLLSFCLIVATSTACSKLAFQAIPQPCEAPADSARFGMSAGPVITEPKANSVVSGVVRIQGTCVNGVTVTIQETTGKVTEAECENSIFSAAVELSGSDGLKDLIVSQKTSNDAKVSSDRMCFTKDTTPPAVNITSQQTAQAVNQPITNVSGVCEDGLPVLISGPGLKAPVQTKCENGHFSATIQTVAGDGTKKLIATQIDPVGNQGQDTAQYIVDTTAPVVRITSPAANTTAQTSILISGTCEAGLRVGLGEPDSMNTDYTDCPNGTFQSQVALMGPDGINPVKVFQVDPAGNIGQDSRNFIKDSTAPVVTISLPLANAYLNPNSTFSGDCETGLSVQLSGSVLSSPITVACNSGHWTLTTSISAGQGGKELVAAQTDAAGNSSQVSRNYQVDTIAPVLAFTSPAAGTYVSSGAMIQGTCETGLLVQISGPGVLTASTANCFNGSFSSSVMISLGDGTKQINLSQTDLAGNTGTASRNFLRDSSAPVLTIASPANGSYVQNAVTLTGACEAGLTVNFSGAGLAAAGTTQCSGGGNYSINLNTSAGDGTKNITASETDAANNTATASASYVKDTTAPTVAITSPAANTEARTGLMIGGTCEAGLNVTINGSGVSSPVSTVCSGTGSFTANINFSNGDGPKLVTASQTDAAGNTGSGSQTFVRNNTSPAIAITSPAANSYVGATFTLTGTCQTGLTVVLGGAGLDSEVSVVCANGAFSSPVTTSAGDGIKAVTATETDAIGNVGQASQNYRRDSAAPILTITSPANGTAVKNTVTLTGACEAGLTISISGAGVASNSSVVCAGNGTYSAPLTLSNGDGVKVIDLSETDGAGNTATASGNYLNDLTPPNIAITSPAPNTEAQNTLTVGGTCEAGPNVTIGGSGVASPVVVACTSGGTFTGTITFTNGDGPKIVTATQSDPLGNVGSASQTFIKDTTGPAIAFTSPAANSYISTSFMVQGTCQSGLPVTIGGAGITSGVTIPCTNDAFTANLTATAGDGSKAVTASQTDMSGNVGTANRSFVIDTQAPILTITSPANGTAVKNTVTIKGACEAGLTVNFSGPGTAGSSSVVCAGNGSYSSLITLSAGDGTKVINLSETDAAGNTATATGSYVNDLTPPSIAITSPDAGTEAKSGLTVGGTCEAGLNVTLAGSGVASPVTTACVAGGTFSGNIVFTNGDGTKTVTASQTDALGNSASDSRDFVRNTVAPAIAITSPAANSYVSSPFTLTGTCQSGLQVTIGGAGLSAGATAACTNGAFSASVSPTAGDGTKNVTVSQTNQAGNTGSDTRNFLVDTQAPVLTITSPIYGSSVKATMTLVGACEAGLTVNFSGTGVASNSSVVCAGNGTYSAPLTLSAGDGNKLINLSETDAAGNMAQTMGMYVKDTTPPAIAITSPAPNTTGRTGLTVDGTCETGWAVTLSGTGVSSPVTTTCSAGGTFSANITFSAGDGNKLVTASQTDVVGNTGSDSRTFIKDNTAPAITITSPAANSYVGATFTLTGACESGLDVTIGGAGVSSGGTVPCTSGGYSTTLTPTSGDGSKAVTASQTDAAGNSATASRNFLVDSQAPVLAITSPANGSYVKNTMTMTGTCEAGLTVNFTGPGVAGNSSVVCAAGGTFSTTLTTSAGDGAKVINLTETDAAGNTASTSGSYIKDSTPPAVAITSPAAGTEAQTTLTVGGICEAGLNVNLSGSGLSAPASTTCSAGGTFTTTITFSNGDGAKSVTASQTDAAGNTGSDTKNFVKDTTAPILTITAPAANSYLGATFTLTGACQTGSPVNITGNGISADTVATCTAGNYSQVLTTSSGDGTKTVTVSQTDNAGNTATVSRNFLRDTQAPVLTITSPAAGSSVTPSVHILGACETAASAVQISGDLAGTVTGPCSSGNYDIQVTFSAGLGTKNVLVRQTDSAGNVGQVTSQFSRDSDAGFETFVSDASFGKIDILFVDDNSASMDPQQASLGTKFSGFSSELQNIDWQIGITTTDCSNGPYGICGSLLTMSGLSQKILTKSVANYQNVFNNTIQRPETAGCLNTGTCPAGNSQPLLSAITAMNKQGTDNAGFFRTDSDLAIVILSDADEGQNSPAAYAGRPNQLVSTFNTNFPSGKKLSVYSIIVKPGDSACLNQLTAANGGFSFYGNYIDQTVGLTSGLSTSICAPDYSVTLKSIGESVRTLTNSVELAHTPIAGTVTVTFNPAQNITYKVIGNKVVFDSPPSVGTQIQVSYQY